MEILRTLAIGFLVTYAIYLHVAVIFGQERMSQAWKSTEQFIKDHPGFLTTSIIGVAIMLPVCAQIWAYFTVGPRQGVQQD